MLVLDLGKEIKKHVQKDEMLAWQYNTIGVSDGITMGGEGILHDSICGRRTEC
jgi:dihydroxy-acid dehydratase